jgi:ribosomal protein S18 acetylase RimI-like enzyme
MEPVIRPYRDADFDGISRVCLLTALAGHDATGVYANDDLVVDIFARPYLLLEPELAFVVDDGEVSGYILGAGDTRRFVDRYRKDWLPGFAATYELPTGETPDDSMRRLGFTPERMLVAEVDEFPAHLHIDLLPHLQGLGLGRRLIETLAAALRERGIRGLHLGIDPANTNAAAFYTHLGFHLLASGTRDEPLYGMAL